jgi:hypothetical protein
MVEPESDNADGAKRDMRQMGLDVGPKFVNSIFSSLQFFFFVGVDQR